MLNNELEDEFFIWLDEEPKLQNNLQNSGGKTMKRTIRRTIQKTVQKTVRKTIQKPVIEFPDNLDDSNNPNNSNDSFMGDLESKCDSESNLPINLCNSKSKNCLKNWICATAFACCAILAAGFYFTRVGFKMYEYSAEPNLFGDSEESQYLEIRRKGNKIIENYVFGEAKHEVVYDADAFDLFESVLHYRQLNNKEPVELSERIGLSALVDANGDREVNLDEVNILYIEERNLYLQHIKNSEQKRLKDINKERDRQ